MLISVVISNFNGARFLPRLISSLREQRGVEIELIVVDRKSADDSALILSGHPDVRVITEPPETGLVSGYHAGSLVARGELLFFCNEDMWFEPDCLRLLAERIDLGARIGSADGWHFGYDDPEVFLHGCTRFVPARWAINSPHPRRSADFEARLPAGSVTPFGCAGAILIHRDMYRDTGGWDTGFFLDHEDIDLFLRGWQRGWKCVSVPEARIHHAVNASNNQTLAALNVKVSHRRYLSQRSSLAVIALKYFSWRAVPLALLVWPAVFLNNLVNGRFEFVRRDILVLVEIIRRTPAAWRFRRGNSTLNASSPGERFFLLPEFSRDA